MAMQKICIYGAGSVGGLLAAELCRAGRAVTLIARGAHLQAMQENGLTVQTLEETYTVRPAATDDPAKAGPQDLVVTTLKAHSIPGAVDGIKTLLGPDTPVCFAQNGIPWWYCHGIDGPLAERRLDILDPGGRIWDEIGPERAIGTTINSPNEVISPGVIKNTTRGKSKFVVGEPRGSETDRIREISAALTADRVEAPLAADIRQGVWDKLMVNLGSWPVAAMTEAPGCDNMSNPALADVARRIMHEGKAVAQSLGIEPDIDIEDRIARFAASSPHNPSLLQDILAGRPVEIDTVLMTTQEFGRLNRVPTPTLDIMIALVESKCRSLGLYSSS